MQNTGSRTSISFAPRYVHRATGRPISSRPTLVAAPTTCHDWNRQSDWQFNIDGDFEGWTPNGYLKAEVKEGLLLGEATGPDPVIQGPGVQIEADRIQRLTIRMRSESDDHAQLFWSTATSSISEGNSLRFKVIGDGQFHDYVLDLPNSPQWRGLVTSLRFDPSSKSRTKFAVDCIRFEQP